MELTIQDKLGLFADRIAGAQPRNNMITDADTLESVNRQKNALAAELKTGNKVTALQNLGEMVGLLHATKIGCDIDNREAQKILVKAVNELTTSDAFGQFLITIGALLQGCEHMGNRVSIVDNIRHQGRMSAEMLKGLSKPEPEEAPNADSTSKPKPEEKAETV